MDSTPVRNTVTPLRRLGLTRSGLRTNSETNFRTPLINATRSEENYETPEGKNATPRGLRPIKSTSSSDDIEEDTTDSPITPCASSSSKCSLKRTRLSLSQSWKQKIVNRKHISSLKRRKLIDEVETCSSVDNITGKDNFDAIADIGLVAENSKNQSSPNSATEEKIEDLRRNIKIWQDGCIQALNDLQSKRGDAGDMESLLRMLQIPFEVVNFDCENQVFLNPD
ncbi:uncharacterized protein LOC129757158 [Uranotaenia lowii]|uniref:uncharacterized protein LOC129757158 n=1 Tax=Uranotaenia lowii TaxID=190385 RepID=UPI002479B580|nr:uncharacterized protein LOC129757158 [Uranotaenia lowii]